MADSTTATINPLLERGMSLALTLAVIALVAILGARELKLLPSSRVNRASPPVIGREVAGWRERANEGLRIGKQSSALQVVVFNDYQCPACRAFHNTFTSFVDVNGLQDVSLSVLRSPLPYHELALPALRAVECAPTEDQRVLLHATLFEKQRALGTQSWASIATEVGEIDTLSFMRCMSDTTTSPQLQKDRIFAKQVGVRSTPTVILNGWLLSRAPTVSELEAALALARSGKPIIGLDGMLNR